MCIGLSISKSNLDISNLHDHPSGKHRVCVCVCVAGVIVIISVAELVLKTFVNDEPVAGEPSGGGWITVLRAARLFRVFKLARSWGALNDVIATVSRSFGSLAPLSIVLFLFMFIFSLLGMQLFGGQFFFPGPPSRNSAPWTPSASFHAYRHRSTPGHRYRRGRSTLEQPVRHDRRKGGPETRCPNTTTTGRGLSRCYPWESWEARCSIPRHNFDSFPNAFITIFQMMTGEDWNVVMYDGIAARAAPDPFAARTLLNTPRGKFRAILPLLRALF